MGGAHHPSLLGVGGIGDMLSVALRHSFVDGAAGGGAEAAAKQIYKTRNMDHEDVMVGRALYTLARRREEAEREGGAGGSSSHSFEEAEEAKGASSSPPPPPFALEADGSITFSLLKRAAINPKLNVSHLSEFFPLPPPAAAAAADSDSAKKAHSLRHLPPTGATFSLRQALGVVIVDDCRYHDVHTGSNKAPITDKSVAIHHLKPSEYADLFRRFGDGAEGGDAYEGGGGGGCQCLDTPMTDAFRKGHPTIRLC